jgi:hypothetical protein
MASFKLDKNWFYALLLAFTASVMLPACSSSEESGSSGGDSDMTCDEGDSKDECLNDIL